MSEQLNEITEGHIPSLIRKIAVPASVGFFFNTMYNIVDAYFSGFAGTEAVAALSLSFPVFFIIIALGSGVSSGITALIAHALGEGNKVLARKYAVQGVSFSIIISIVLTILGFLISPPLFRALGATGVYLDFALAYTNVIFLGASFFILVFSFNAILNSVGDTKSFRNFLIVGFFLNFILNYWFMFGGLGVPAMGIAGIALATVTIQLFGVFYMFAKVVRTGLLDRGFYRQLWPEKGVYLDIAKQGIPASVSMMSIAIGFFIATYFVSKFGVAAVAAYGVGTRVQQLALLPLIGLNIAAVTLVGQNKGAKKLARVMETSNKTHKYAFIISMLGTVFLFFLARPLMSLFSSDPEVVRIGTSFLRIVAFAMWPYALLMLTDSVLLGLKRPMFSLWMGLSRQIVAPAIVFCLFVYVFSSGVSGIWWGLFTITIISSIIARFYLRAVLKKTADFK